MTRSRPPLRFESLEDRVVPAYGLDPTFGDGGRFVGTDLPGVGIGYQVVPLPDGDLLVPVGGEHMSSPESAFGVVRLNPDGTPDVAFGTNGFAAVPSLPGWTYFDESELVVQADGRIVVGTVALNQPTNVAPPLNQTRGFVTARLNADGSLDTTYGTGGLALAAFGPTFMVFEGMAAGPDGSVVLVAMADNDWAVARMTAGGVPDPTFDGDGRLILNVGGDRYTLAVSDVAVDAAGRVVIGGTVPVVSNGAYSSGTDGAVVRLNPDGSLDTTFDGDGVRPLGLGQRDPTVSPGVPHANVYGVELMPDGRIIALALGNHAYSADGYTGALTVARLNADGSYDTSFDGDGKRDLFGFTTGDFLPHLGLALDADGRVFVSGTTYTEWLKWDFGVAALRPDGSIDTDFTGGPEHLAVPFDSIAPQDTAFPYRDSSFAITALPDGRVVLVGLVGDIGGSHLAVAMLVEGGLPLAPPEPPTQPPMPEPPIPGEPPIPPYPFPPTPPIPVEPPVSLPSAFEDLDGDGTDDALTVDGSRLMVVSGADGAVLIDGFAPYEESFTGGITALLVDLDGDGRAEVITAPNIGGAARIQVFAFEGGTLVQRDNFFAFPDDGNYRGGASIACGDVDGDGLPDLIVGAGDGGGPRVAVFDGLGLLGNADDPDRLVADFFAFDDPGFRGGVNVVTQDLDYDGRADVVAAAGAGGGPRVAAFGGDALCAGDEAAPLYDGFYGTDISSRGGVDLATELTEGRVLVLGTTDAGDPMLWSVEETLPLPAE